jgi:hypothetical protein
MWTGNTVAFFAKIKGAKNCAITPPVFAALSIQDLIQSVQLVVIANVRNVAKNCIDDCSTSAYGYKVTIY